MKIRTGDTIIVISGKDKGKTGEVLRVFVDKDRVIVSGANMRTRHIKKTPQSPGERVKYEASLHVSNVMLIDPKTKKRTRIGYIRDTKGKWRIAKTSGETISLSSKERNKKNSTPKK